MTHRLAILLALVSTLSLAQNNKSKPAPPQTQDEEYTKLVAEHKKREGALAGYLKQLVVVRKQHGSRRCRVGPAVRLPTRSEGCTRSFVSA